MRYLFLFSLLVLMCRTSAQNLGENSLYKHENKGSSQINNIKGSLYPWEIAQAEVLPNGDLQWAPHPFIFTAGNSPRYIDFENGDDNNDGQGMATAWKHHPWDIAATGTARTCTGVHSYVFKRGVVYRGVLNVSESGEPNNPIRLTSDPSWGSGEAAIYGSVMVSGGWTRADATIAPNIPNANLVWYKNIGILENPTKVVCEITGGTIKRVFLARSPDFVDTPEEPMKTWWSFTNKQVSNGNLNLTDVNHLVQTQIDYYKDGDVWAIEDAVTMATLWKKKILDYTPSTKTISVALDGGLATFGGKDCKYFVENTPYLLSSPSEYFYDKSTGRIFLRLEGDKDPNTTIVEIASRSNLLTATGKSNIEISGLTIGFTTTDNIRYTYSDGIPALNFTNCSNIIIKNCKFHYVNGGILANGTGDKWNISDNEMNYIDDFSVILNGPDVVTILRNKIYESGTRHMGRWYSCIPAIAADPLSDADVAGNIIEHAWGSGINLRWGKTTPSTVNIPFIRGFVHHNRVSHSLQGVNDYGGIESWQGGPVFTYNNISEDAQGWHYNWWIGNVISLGYPFYNDGVFKHYVFNNIASGTGWNRCSGAYMQVLGFYNMYVHNNAYNTSAFTNSGDFDFAIDGQNCYLANVSDSTERQIDHTTIAQGVPFDSYGNNIFSGNGFMGCFVTNGTGTRNKLNFDDFCKSLNAYNPDLGQVGFVTSKRVFENPSSGNFIPKQTSELIDRGVKFFVPFPLSRVVGEWNFYKHKSDSTIIKGENFYFTSEFNTREMYKTVPKNHMKAFGLKDNSFVIGELEDWTEGALVFDGSGTYCKVLNSAISSTVCNNLNMTTNDFIIETFFKTVTNHTGGTIISKYGSTGYGYIFDIDPTGNIRFSIVNSLTPEYRKSGSIPVNDGSWHHILIEVNRQTSLTDIYIDGALANGATTGSLPSSSVSLFNNDDFLVGKNMSGNFFAGTIDFLRLSKGTLAEAKTSIEELYKWETDGPYLHDFTGKAPVGKRDAGALEKGTRICNMTVSETELRFDASGGAKAITVQAAAGFEIAATTGTFFSYSVAGNIITVNVAASGNSYTGDIYILGCNETVRVKVIQGNPTAIDDIIYDNIKVYPNPVSGHSINISIPESLKNTTARFIALSGTVFKQHSLNPGDNIIDINLPGGIYLLYLSGPAINYTMKLIVKH